MNHTAATSPQLSLSALHGAVGDVVGVADGAGCWDRVVSIWRIFLALDGLMAALWAIVHRLRCGDGLDAGDCVVAAVLDERPVVAGSGLVRRRAVAGVRAVAGRRVLTGAVASVGRVRRFGRVGWRRRRRGRVLRRVLAVRCRLISEPGVGLSRNCVLIVPV